jgi:hypothetical protein
VAKAKLFSISSCGTAKQAAEKVLIASQIPEEHPSGAKARIDFGPFTARLKSCPVTKPPQIATSASFSAAGKAVPSQNVD